MLQCSRSTENNNTYPNTIIIAISIPPNPLTGSAVTTISKETGIPYPTLDTFYLLKNSEGNYMDVSYKWISSDSKANIPDEKLKLF